MEVKGRCIQIENRDKETGIASLKIFLFSEVRQIRAVGAITSPVKNMEYCFRGSYHSDGSFRFSSVRRTTINWQESVGILTSSVPGISERIAQSIVKELGEDIFLYPEEAGFKGKLEKVSGIGPKRAAAIIDFLCEEMDDNAVFNFLSNYNIPYTAILEILRAYQKEKLGIIQSNPYVLMEYDVNFETCDTIAMQNHIDPWSVLRINALIKQIFGDMSQRGDTRMELTKFMECISSSSVRAAESVVSIPWSLIELVLYSNQDVKLYMDRKIQYITTKELFYDEMLIVQNLKRLDLSGYSTITKVNTYIDMMERKEGIRYNAEQRKAFEFLERGGIALLSGEPGTGKTTTINGIIKIALEFFPDKRILLCAPTGSAAARMAEISKKEAKTMHKAMKLKKCQNEWKTDILDFDLIIIDEMSLCDTETFALFVQAIRSGTMLLLAGDYNQLPSVRPGQVFKDLIHSGVFTHYHLVHTVRQKMGSTIIKNARHILKGQPLVEGKDFKITYFNNDNVLINYIKSELDMEALPQILCPVKEQMVGVKTLNHIIQSLFNWKSKSIWLDDNEFYAGDKIIMNKNNYKPGAEYMNGDVGWIEDISDSNIRIKLSDKQLTIRIFDIKGLDLAYVLTVHKSQGTECDKILLVLPESSKCMASRQVLYTAISRARDSVEILAVPDVLEAYLEAEDRDNRNTGLYSGLIDIIEY